MTGVGKYVITGPEFLTESVAQFLSIDEIRNACDLETDIEFSAELK